jgi:predicted XRE-type DNA-binding protein
MKSHEEKILEILDKILKVLSLQVAADKSMTERARLLKVAGLDNATIATVLNTSPSSISVLTSGVKKNFKKKKQKQKL